MNEDKLLQMNRQDVTGKILVGVRISIHNSVSRHIYSIVEDSMEECVIDDIFNKITNSLIDNRLGNKVEFKSYEYGLS
jgi:hypothetical protein